MNFTEVVAEVLAAVKRPDLLNRIKKEVNSAINFYVLENEFSRDFAEQSITLDAQAYTQSFSLSELTRFRRFKYLKRGGTKSYLSIVSNTEMFAGCTDADKYYIAGLNVNLSLARTAPTLDVGYFVYPPVLTDTVGSRDFWLIEISPWMVVDRAAAAIYRSIGDEKSMQTHAVGARESYMAFKADQLKGS